MVKVELALCLPRDARSVATVREVATDALKDLAVSSESIDDIRLALSEACTNVILHSGVDDEYEVRLQVSGEVCEIRVIDAGRGLDFGKIGFEDPDPLSSRGRGLAIIHSLADTVEFRSEPEKGTMVHLVKRVKVGPGSPLADPHFCDRDDR